LGATPTPTPVISPVSYRVIVNDTANATHFIAVDLIDIQRRAPEDWYHDMLMNGHYAETNSRWFAWTGARCPPTYECGGGVEGPPWNGTANLWECWFDENDRGYCHPVASKYVPGWRLVNTHLGDLDSGVELFYNGTWGTSMRLSITCDPNPLRPLNDLSIENSRLVYSTSMYLGAVWRFNTTSRIACPRKFEQPAIPSSPRPLPPSHVEQVYRYKAMMGSKQIAFDLRKMPNYFVDQTILGSGDTWYRVRLHYSPYDLITCPNNQAGQRHNCSIYNNDKANVWYCAGGTIPFNDCFPVGDRRYGLKTSFIDPTMDASGVNVSYLGGAGNFSIEFHFHCDLAVPYGNFMYGMIGSQIRPLIRGQMPHIAIHVHTREVCLESDFGGSKGGAFFLLVVFVFTFLYFGVGTFIIYFSRGTVSVPNEEFWLEVWESFLTPFLCIGSGGTAIQTTGPVYSKI
jgi:hypothetical protein